MGAQVLDFHALVRALEEHPEWRTELRRLVLSEELLALPESFRRLEEELTRLAATVQQLVANQAQMQRALQELAEAQKRTEQEVKKLAQAQTLLEQQVKELAEAQKRTEQEVKKLAHAQTLLEQQVKELAEAQKRTEERVEELAQAQTLLEQQVKELAEAQKRTERRVEELAQAQARTEKRVEELAVAQTRTESALLQLTLRVDSLTGQVGELRGQFLEMRFREKAPAYLGRYLRRVRVLPSFRVAELLDQAVEAGRINWDERQEVLLADAVVQGLAADGSPLSLVVEVSGVVDERDVVRAVERAEILAKALATPVQAAVAGQEIPEPTHTLARRLGVLCFQDGRQLPASEGGANPS